ncbi:MAG TPA: OmpA family protein [Candidatus Xenobia bacterium]|nr:OmpA family protein [Candidatus Xenobia bacterium]
MRKLGLAALVGPMLWFFLPPTVNAQVYMGSEKATPKNVYCSGFLAGSPLSNDLRLIGSWDAAGRLIYSQFDYVYINKGADAGIHVGQRYLIVRRYEFDFTDPDPIEAFPKQKEMFHAHGTYYQDIGRLEVVAVNDTTSTALVTEICDPVQMGDILIPFEERPVPTFRPPDGFDRFAAATSPQGTVIIAQDFVNTAGQGDAVYVNIGSSDGLKVGDYLRFWRWGRVTDFEGYKGIVRGQWRHYHGVPRDGYIPIDTKTRNRLPRELIGEGMVVHADQRSATVIVSLSLTEIHAGDFVEPQPPQPPTADITVVPDRIVRGQMATVSWVTRSANQVDISGLGTVTRRGTENIFPTQTTTFRLTASGPGGSAEDSATITVVEPPTPQEPTRPPDISGMFAQNVQDIFFDFNKADIRADAASTLQRAATFLRQHPNVRVRIEGHCDEIGTDEYNAELGQRRADNTAAALIQLGVNSNQLRTVSIGRSTQFCAESMDESCRQLNRRAHFELER